MTADPRALARIAYLAYLAAAPGWDELPPAEQDRWVASASTVANTIIGPGYQAGKEGS